MVARGLQQTSLKVAFAETHRRPKHLPDLQSMRRVQEGTCHVCLIHRCSHTAQHIWTQHSFFILFLFFFSCFSEICCGVGPTFSSTIAPAVLARSFRTSSLGPGSLSASRSFSRLSCFPNDQKVKWSLQNVQYVPPISDLQIKTPGQVLPPRRGTCFFFFNLELGESFFS